MNKTDEELYDGFLFERSEDDLLTLIKRHREGLMLFINGFVHDISKAEELALDAFAEAAAGPTFFSGRSSFKTWLFSIGRNKARRHLRQTALLENIEQYEEAAGQDSPELQILRDERNAQLYKALSRINDDYRRILILLYFEEMTTDEAAKVMGKSKRQVYSLTERGKGALKKELLRMGFEYDDA